MRSTTQLCFSTIAFAALLTSAGAQHWDELTHGGGDAGDVPATAQIVFAAGGPDLFKITGRLTSTADRADLFQIIIESPTLFYALTGTDTETTFDSKLTLYNSAGHPLWFNDDRPASPMHGFTIGTFKSYIGHGAAASFYRRSETPNSSGSAIWGLPLTPGFYYLAISHWTSRPQNAAAQDLWFEGSPFSPIYYRFDAREGDVLANWTAPGSGGFGSYTIHLGGASYVPEPASMVALGVGLVGLLKLRRRKR